MFYNYILWLYLTFLGYGQLLVLDESLTVLLVLVDIIEIALCVIVLSEINDDDDYYYYNHLYSPHQQHYNFDIPRQFDEFNKTTTK